MCVGVWGRDEYRVGVREWHGTVRAKTARSGVRGVRIKQGRAVTRRGQKGRLVSRAAAGQKRQEVLQRCWLVMARILLCAVRVLRVRLVRLPYSAASRKNG